MRQLIAAITADTFLGRASHPNQERADYAPRPLVDALSAAGLLSIILPYNEKADAKDYVSSFDGLVIPGGPNMSPKFYGEEPLWCIGATYEKRDKFEVELIKAAMAAEKPIFGICRGLQVINVALGGSLWQDMQVQCPSITIQHMQKTPVTLATHSIEIEPGSRLHSILGNSCRVNSFHKEGVKKLGEGLAVTARSADGCIEAFESKDNDLITAVQWHPENMAADRKDMAALFAHFAERMERYARRRIVRQ